MGMIEAIGLALTVIGVVFAFEAPRRRFVALFKKPPADENPPPLKFRSAFAASIVFNQEENLPQVFFDLGSDIGKRLASKSSIARPYQNIDGNAVLLVPVPITDDQKFLHGVEALQCKMLVDICDAQRGGAAWGWSAEKGVIPAKITVPNTPDPITKIPGTVVLDAMASSTTVPGILVIGSGVFGTVIFAGITPFSADHPHAAPPRWASHMSTSILH